MIGANSISMALTKAAKLPTDVPCPALCASATEITADKAKAASIWVKGVMAADAVVDFIDSRCSEAPSR